MNIETRGQNMIRNILANFVQKADENRLRLLFTVASELAGGLTDRDAMDTVSAAIINHLQTMTESELVMTLKYIHALKDFREVTA